MVKVHLIIQAKRERWLNTHMWWVRVVGPERYVPCGVSDQDLDRGVRDVVKHVRYWGDLPKYTRITWEFAPCPPGVGPGMPEHTWDSDHHQFGTCLLCGAQRGTANDAAMEILVTDKDEHAARVAELIDRNKGFLT